MCGCFSRAPHWGPGLQPRMCPDWESNQRPFGSQASAQSTEPRQPGPCMGTLAERRTIIIPPQKRNDVHVW